MRIFMSAGEASGDALGASLIAALKRHHPDADGFDAFEVFGMGGPRMEREGFRAIHRSSEVSVVGIFEVLFHLPRLFRLASDLAREAIERAPDVAVLIDVPDFHLRVAKRLTRAGIPVVVYVAPSVWAWRPGRVRTFKPWMRRLLVLFPFEVAPWAEAGVDVVCVGHPLLDEIAPADRSGRQAGTVVLLPGSRRTEIARHLGTLLGAAKVLSDRSLASRFVLPVAPGLDPGLLEAEIDRRSMRDRVELVLNGDEGARRRSMARGEVALVASGTATLEAALLGLPQVIFYRVGWLSYVLGRSLMRVKHFGLPNIIAGREIAPELLQGAFSERSLVLEAERLLTDDRARAEAIASLREVRDRLGPGGAAERAALAVLEIAGERRLAR